MELKSGVEDGNIARSIDLFSQWKRPGVPYWSRGVKMVML